MLAPLLHEFGDVVVIVMDASVSGVADIEKAEVVAATNELEKNGVALFKA